MRKRFLGVFLCLGILLSSISVSGLANGTEQSYDSLASLMNCELETISDLDFQFADGFGSSNEYVTTPAGADYGSNGLDLTGVTATEAQASWRYKPENGWDVFDYGDAVFLRAKVNSNGGNINVQFYHSDESGNSLRYYMNISETKLSVSNDIGSPAGDFSFVPGSDWVDYFIKKNNDDGFSVYLKASATQNLWRHYLTVAGDSWKASTSNEIGIALFGTHAGSDSTGGYVRELVVLKKSSLNSSQGNAVYQEDFERMPEYHNYLLSSGVITDGALILDGSSSLAGFSLQSAEIPDDGIARFRIKADASSMISFDDSIRRFSFSPMELSGVSSKEYTTWMIQKNADGTLSGYYQKDSDSFWYTAFESKSGDATSGATEISFSAEGGTLVIDSISIYAPDSIEDFVITDGAGGRMLKAGSCPDRLDSVAVTVKPDNERQRTLLVGVYGENGVLADSVMKEIPVSEKALMVVCDAQRKIQNIRKIRVFLWDGFSGVGPLASSVMLTGNLPVWTDAWKTAGAAYADYDALVLDSQSGESSTVTLETEIDSLFDLSWDMVVTQFGGDERIEIDNGTDAISMRLCEDGVSFSSESGEVFLPWIIQFVNHNYRLIADGNRYLLFIDGYFVGEISAYQKSDGADKISFSNCGNASMRVHSVSLGVYSEINVPAQGFLDDFEEDECGWILTNPQFNTGIVGDFWKIENGNLRVADEHIALDYTTYCVSDGYKEITEIGDEFLIQTRLAFPSFGTRSYLIVRVDGRCFALDIREKFFSIKPIVESSNVASKPSDEIDVMDSTYHMLTIESYNHKKNVRIYLDGDLVLDDVTEAYSGKNNEIRFMMDGGFFLPASLDIDYIKYVPMTYSTKLLAPVNNTMFAKGETIAVSATDYADFILNGVKVASGTAANFVDLPPGVYRLEARGKTGTADVICFTVKDAASASLRAEVDANTVTVLLDKMSSFDSVASVTYLLDGKKVTESKASPFAEIISDVSAENHTIEAVCYDKDGIEIARVGEEICVLAGNTDAYSYHVSYQMSGKGTVDVMNGNHHLQMSHKSTGFRYLTDEGTKSYNFESDFGAFDVLTDGPVAEVYMNGQFVLSFFMPSSTESPNVINENAENLQIQIPKERKNYFSARNLKVQGAVYELFNLEHSHNFDFVAGVADEGHITLNDGYFRTDVTLQDGSLFVWSVDRNNSDPQLTKVTDLKEEDVYYRVETSGGMSRLYADGRWITTFRNAIASGSRGTLAVHCSSGDGFSYLGVNSNDDLYFYQDTFNGSGEFDSADYWTVSGGNVILTPDSETMQIQAESGAARAELNAYVGNALLSADINVNDDVQGVWLYGNHCVTESYTKAGYNFATQQFEIVNCMNGEEILVASKNGTFPKGTVVSVALSVKETSGGRWLSLSVNGEVILSTTDEIDSRGTIGIAVNEGSIYVDNVKFRGDAKPLLDVRMNPIAGAPNALDMIETDERTYLAAQNVNGYYTTNGGKTWERFTPSANAGFGPSGYGGMTKNMVKLQSGEIVSIHRNAPETWVDAYGQRKAVYQAYVSTDGGQGMTWYKPGNANFPDQGSQEAAKTGRDATVNRITQGPSGRIYYVSGEGNSEDYGDAIVWMSDDDGKNWFKSDTEISALNLGYVVAEAVVIETGSSTRLYFRTDIGQLCYFESYDRGISWDLTLHTTPFISSMTCFGIEADPEDPDTIYLAWGYDNINVFARAQFPRNRWAVAKSSDGGNSWEMIGTVHENNSSVTQSMNMSINVSKDYIYVTGASSDVYQESDDSKANRIIAFPKEKQRSSVRMEQVHLKSAELIENTVVLADHQKEFTMAVNPSNGTVLLHNQLLTGVSEGEYVPLDILGAFVGASSVEENGDGSVVFVIGGHNVKKYGCDVKEISQKPYIQLSSFAEKMGLYLFDAEGIKILTTEKNWSRRQIQSICHSVDLFSNEP